MQITGIDPQARIMPAQIAQKARKHAVLIAQERDPILAPRMARHQIVNDPGAIGTPIHQIANMHDGAWAICRLIGSNSVMRGFQEVQLAVDVAVGVGSQGARSK